MAQDAENNRSAESSEAGSQSPRLSDRVAKAGDASQSADPLPGGEPNAPEELAFADYVHVGRVVKPAGQMLIGSRVVAPVGEAGQALNASLKQPQIFSSASETRRRGVSGGKAIMLICAVAAGATALITKTLEDNADTNGGPFNEPARYAGTAVSGRPDAANVANVAARIEPEAAPASSLPGEAGEPVVIRIASNDAPGLTVENISGAPGEPLAVKVSVGQRDTEEYAFIMFRGMPDDFAFSAGFRLKDSWAVSLRDLAQLQMLPPPGYEGRFDVEVLLVKGRDKPVESQVMTVAFGDAPPPAAEITASTAPPPAAEERLLTAAPPAADVSAQGLEPEREQAPSRAQPAPQRTISAEKENEILERAMKVLGDGDVASARLLLEHIARQGSGKGALTLAQTYDPLFFRSINTLGGVSADPKKAVEWYSIAAELGQDGARARLSALSSR